ncbi:MAG: Ig domain-containing protein [Selenomonadaceae bacterium]|nr:Ig domain-containing protein [Selenomonadaceae bacterium]
MIRKFFATILLTAIIFFAQSVSAESYLTYQAHVEGIGWMREVGSGEVAGTTDQSRRLEAIVINFSDGIEYNAHVQDIGWQGWRYSGGVAGTVGESRRMEAIRIRLTGRLANDYDVYYRAHVQDIGWQNWVRNGEVAGTAGRSLRLEALQIKIVPKNNRYGDDYNHDRRNRYDDDYNNDRYDHDRYGRHEHRRW